MKQIFFLIVGLFFIGCSQQVSPVKQYRLDVVVQNQSLQKFTCKQKSVKILFPTSTYEYTTNKFFYVQGLEEGSYIQSSWARTPVSEIYLLLLKNLRQSGAFKTVQNYVSVAHGDLNLEVDIQNFKQYFSKDAKSSYVVADITLTLIDKKSYQVMAQKNFYKKLQTSSADAKGGVEAFNKVLEMLLPDMIKWIGGSCS